MMLLNKERMLLATSDHTSMPGTNSYLAVQSCDEPTPESCDELSAQSCELRKSGYTCCKPAPLPAQQLGYQ